MEYVGISSFAWMIIQHSIVEILYGQNHGTILLSMWYVSPNPSAIHPDLCGGSFNPMTKEMVECFEFISTGA